MFCVDENNNDQILCCALMTKKMAKSFEAFLQEVKIRSENIN